MGRQELEIERVSDVDLAGEGVDREVALSVARYDGVTDLTIGRACWLLPKTTTATTV